LNGRGLSHHPDTERTDSIEVARHALVSIDMKLQGLAPLRGMGLMMIAQLVDEAGFTESHDGGNHFRLSLYRRA